MSHSFLLTQDRRLRQLPYRVRTRAEYDSHEYYTRRAKLEGTQASRLQRSCGNPLGVSIEGCMADDEVKFYEKSRAGRSEGAK